jgi:HEAT repeat protein
MSRTVAVGLGLIGVLLASLLITWVYLGGTCDVSEVGVTNDAPAALAEKNTEGSGTAPQEPKPAEPGLSSSKETVHPERSFITEKGVAAAKQVDALSSRLDPDVVTELRSILNDSSEGELLRNNVANKLRQCGDGQLVADLARMYSDERETPKWRNYCVQHLYSAFENSRDPAILGTIFEAADPDRTDKKEVRICAVWSLARATTPRDKRKVLDNETLVRIRAVALDALREKEAHFLIRTAGVQSCARLGLTEALPDIRELAGDESTKPTHLRVVSIAALGDLGDETDVPLLERLSSSAKGQLKSAAALATKKITARAAEPKPAASDGIPAPTETQTDAEGPTRF